MQSKIMRSIYRYVFRCENTIHRILGYPKNGLLEELEDVLTVLVILAPLFVIGAIIWILYKWTMIRLGKDTLTNYRHYQKTFIDNYTNAPCRIANNIFEYPHYLHNCKKTIRQCLTILFIIASIIALMIYFRIYFAPTIFNLFYTIYHQFRRHRYTNHAFFSFVVRNIWKIVFRIVIPLVISLAVFIIIIILGKGLDTLYKKTNLLFKTRTRITTKIHRVRKVCHEKSDV